MNNEFSKYNKRGAYHWDEISNSIRTHNAFTKGRYQKLISYITGNNNENRILDIGCGDGALTFQLSKHANTVVGIDSSNVGIRLAKKNIERRLKKDNSEPKVLLIRASANKIPIKKGYFNYAIVSDVIEHLNTPEQLLGEANEVLASNGSIIVTTPCKLTEEPLDLEHVREYFPDELRNVMEKFFHSCVVEMSHPLFFLEMYTLKIGPKPFFKYFINLLSVLGFNSFLLHQGFRYYTHITAVGKKS